MALDQIANHNDDNDNNNNNNGLSVIAKIRNRQNISINVMKALISLICVINLLPYNLANCQTANDTDCRYMRRQQQHQQLQQSNQDTNQTSEPQRYPQSNQLPKSFSRQQRLYLRADTDSQKLSRLGSNSLVDSQLNSQEFNLQSGTQSTLNGPHLESNESNQTNRSNNGAQMNGGFTQTHQERNSSLETPLNLTSPSMSQENSRVSTPPTTSLQSSSTNEPQNNADSVSPSMERAFETVTERVGKHQSIENDKTSTESEPVKDQEAFSPKQVSKTNKIGLGQPISSAPASISIITPILGHSSASAAAAAASDFNLRSGMFAQPTQSMMRPLYVLGNPIGERDYNPSTSSMASSYDMGSQQSYQSNSIDSSSLSRPRLPKIADSNSGTSNEEQRQSSTDEPQPSAQVTIAKKSVTPKLLDSQPASLSTPPSLFISETQAMMNSTMTEQTQSTHPMLELNATSVAPGIPFGAGDKISGPSLVYTDGKLTNIEGAQTTTTVLTNTTQTATSPTSQTISQQPLAPRLYQSSNSLVGSNTASGPGVIATNPRRPSLPPTVNQANAASGFRSPVSPSGPLVGGTGQQTTAMIQPPINSMSGISTVSQVGSSTNNFYQTSLPPYLGPTSNAQNSLTSNQIFNSPSFNRPSFMINSQGNQMAREQQIQIQQHQVFAGQGQSGPSSSTGVAPSSSNYSGRRPLNITRVEHISAECSNDLMRAVIVFNGTFKGMIYSSGYVNDPTCLYVNGTGLTRYEFSIRLNQCGTLGRQELHQPTAPGEARRRDQVMWNTLTIQYNSIIEQEWDEHFRVSCEYGSDFWKTVSFSPFNVETNTGSPVVFTINPPQCQMDVLLGHGIGPKIAVDGPVTVGDPLTLLIHMKSEKAGYDILVKNCVAHNGGKQRMQLIDSNGCVVNERFISPFRGTYNDNDLRHVTLYAYFKAFRFTGSPVLYLECEIHMCQSACPPQMCYWRRLSKRSIDDFEYEYQTNSTNTTLDYKPPVISDSLNLFKALQVRQESEQTSSKAAQRVQEVFAEDSEAQLVCYRHAEVLAFFVTTGILLMLLCSVAVACCLRVRKISRGQYKHDRFSSTLSTSSSLSPSLVSIGDVFSGVESSILSAASRRIPSPNYCNQTTRYNYPFSTKNGPPQQTSFKSLVLMRKPDTR